jgi:lysozyme
MVLSERGLQLIMAFEGFSPTVYICSAGYPTIGYGHAIFNAEEEARFRAAPITKQDAAKLLEEDTTSAVRSVNRLTKVSLTQNQFDALVSFVFNLGGGAYQRSTLRKAVNRGQFLEAAEEFPKWSRASGRIVQGLVRRRLAERSLFLT